MFNSHYFPNFMIATDAPVFSPATTFGASLETDYLFQTTAYWASLGVDRDSVKKVSAPFDLSVRWEFEKDEIYDPQRGTISTDVQLVVDQVLVVGSLMWLGGYSDFVDGSDTLYEVVRYEEIPDIKNQFIRKEASLIRYHNKLPTVI